MSSVSVIKKVVQQSAARPTVIGYWLRLLRLWGFAILLPANGSGSAAAAAAAADSAAAAAGFPEGAAGVRFAPR